MFLFFSHKAFFDGWDNLYNLIVMNIGFLAIGGLLMVLPSAISLPGWFFPVFLLAALVASSIWLAAATRALLPAADSTTIEWRAVFRQLRPAVKPGLQLAAMVVPLSAVFTVTLPYYLSGSSYLSILAFGLLLWVGLFCILVLQFFLAVEARYQAGFAQSIRHCLVLVLDSPGFAILLLMHNSLTLVVSAFLALLAPGPAAVMLNINIAVKLRQYKLNWLAEHNPTRQRGRQAIPWPDLLQQDRELLGKRSLRGLIFPWKD